MALPSLRVDQLESVVARTIAAQPVVDMHTHLYPPPFGTPVDGAFRVVDPNGLMLFGIDEMLTYHYLVAEVFRVVPAWEMPYENFFALSKREQADHVWQNLFLRRTPLSEACRGVVTTLSALGLDPQEKNIEKLRNYFAQANPGQYVDRVMEVANVSSIAMTNDPFDANERARWLRDPMIGNDGRFRPVLRIDPLLVDWPAAARTLTELGYVSQPQVGAAEIDCAKRFLWDWVHRIQASYVVATLPPTFRYPAESNDPTEVAGQTMLEKVVLPLCEDLGLPLALMIGTRRQVNPPLRNSGDFVGKSDIMAVARLCQQFPNNKFMVTMLSRENQHELCVAARKFDNLMVFGCWWFLNNPSLIEEITTMRIELLGTSFIPQHSDARVLDQLVYKWSHARLVVSRVLTKKYKDLLEAGWPVTGDDVARDVRDLFRDNFLEFLSR